MENPTKMDDLGGKPTIFGNTQNMFICMESETYFTLTIHILFAEFYSVFRQDSRPKVTFL